MSRKDYELIAAAFVSAAASMDSRTAKQVVYFTASVTADRLCSTNPRFDRARFLLACGVN